MSWRQHQEYKQPTDNCGDAGEVMAEGWRDERPVPKLVDGNHLMVRSTSLYKGGPCSLEVPHVLGSYSVDGQKNIHFDDSEMSVLNKKYISRGNECMEVMLDLNRGRNQVQHYTTTTTEIFRQFLQWILKNQKKLRAEDSSNKLMADFVVARIILQNIMIAPYANALTCGITLFAQYFKGSVYMDFHVCEDHEEEQWDELSEVMENLQAYGHMFEQYMTGDHDEVIHCNSQFRCVLKQHLNELTLLYPIPTDAIDQTRHQCNFKDMSSFVSLKVCRECTEPYKQRNYRKFTLHRWWTESQLSGIPRLLKGTRNYDGIVQTLQMLETADFPDQAEGEWEPSVCINFLAKFLNFVKEKVFSEPHKVHRFERSAKAGHCFFHYHDTSGTDILPKWYREQLFASEEETID